MNCCALSPFCPSSTGPTSMRSRSRVSSIAFAHFEGSEPRLLPRAILHRVHVEREDFFLARLSRACRSPARSCRRAIRAAPSPRAAPARGRVRAIRRSEQFRKCCAPRAAARRARQYPPCETSPTSASRAPDRCRRPLLRPSCPALPSAGSHSAWKTFRCGWR